MLDMKRREFVMLLGGGAVAWPLAVRAQERMRRIGVLMNTLSEEPEAQARVAAFLQGLQEAGWSVGRNVRIETRWGGGDNARLRKSAVELVALNPDVILAGTGSTVTPVQEASRTIPIVFAQAIDPVGAGNVETLARPNTNATGFLQFEYSLSAKWLELLKELMPQVKRVGVLRDPSNAAGIGQWAVIQAAAQPLNIELSTVDLRAAGEIESASTISELNAAFATFGRERPDALFVSNDPSFTSRRVQVILHTTRHAIPATYPARHYPEIGGLMSYGASIPDAFRQVGVYAGRILKGAKPADLPVVQSSKFVINALAARMLGLDVASSLLATADEVIE